MKINSLLKLFCKFDYHIKIRLVDVTIGFGPSGKVEKVECQICKKIFIRKNSVSNYNNFILIIIIILLIIIFIV